MRNPYAEVIRALREGNINYGDVVWRIAETNPSIILRAIAANQAPVAGWKKQCLDLALAENGKIPAIKLWREKTGDGLKEAKEAVEKMVDDVKRA